MSLAEEITQKLGKSATPIPGTTGQFDVVVDGHMIFSKHAQGRFPDHDEILVQLA